MGPVAVIPEQEKPTAIIYVSGQSTHNPNQTLIVKYTDDEETGWKDIITIPNYPYSFTGLISLPSTIIQEGFDILILGGIKLEKENGQWVSSSQVLTIYGNGESYDSENLMTMEEGSESPDFFFDNQFLQVTDTRGARPILTTYCLGRSIYRVTHDG